LKIGVLRGVGQYAPYFRVEKDVPHQPFINGMNALQLCCWQFLHKETL